MGHLRVIEQVEVNRSYDVEHFLAKVLSLGAEGAMLKDASQEFFIGSGLSDAQRKDPPKVGDVTTFKHYGYTKYVKPKFASFMRVRRD